MKDREKRYSEGLEKCRTNIEKTKRLIEYHKVMLKNLLKKESRYIALLKREKLGALYKAMEQGGYDLSNIDKLIEAVGKNNDVTPDSKVGKNADKTQTKNPSDTEEKE